MIYGTPLSASALRWRSSSAQRRVLPQSSRHTQRSAGQGFPTRVIAISPSSRRRAYGLFHVAGTIGVAAETHNLHLVPDTLAMRAAILRIVGWNTATGRICAFLRASHSPPLPIQETPFRTGHLEVRCQNRSNSSSIRCPCESKN
jgi:hypothetical protein